MYHVHFPPLLKRRLFEDLVTVGLCLSGAQVPLLRGGRSHQGRCFWVCLCFIPHFQSFLSSTSCCQGPPKNKKHQRQVCEYVVRKGIKTGILGRRLSLRGKLKNMTLAVAKGDHMTNMTLASEDHKDADDS